MILAETVVGKLGMGLVLYKKRAEWQDIAKDYADTLYLSL